MTIKTPPVDWDRHALVVARSIASLDRARLPGSTTQFTAIVHEAIVDAMMMAAESNTPEAAVVVAHSQASASVEHGTADKPEPGKLKAALADLQDVRGAVAEFRKQHRDSYPREAVVMLLDAFDQLVRIADGALREVATCAKTQTGGAPSTVMVTLNRNLTCAACGPNACDGRALCGARLIPAAVRPFREASSC
jgi:hypothetical protein